MKWREILYDSLHDKLLSLDDTVEVYPAHGAGSICGRNISQARASTVGEQRRFNYALKPMPREEFIQIMTAELPQAPS
jgi:hydroxyacylglutathione hydrolase